MKGNSNLRWIIQYEDDYSNLISTMLKPLIVHRYGGICCPGTSYKVIEVASLFDGKLK